MRGRSEMRDLRQIAELRRTEVAAARHALALAEQALEAARRETVAQQDGRDAALDLWRAAIGARRPDPEQFAALGAWVNLRDGQCRTAQLDESIAAATRETTTRICAEKMALRDVSDELRARARRREAREREERAATAASELHAIRRGR